MGSAPFLASLTEFRVCGRRPEVACRHSNAARFPGLLKKAGSPLAEAQQFRPMDISKMHEIEAEVANGYGRKHEKAIEHRLEPGMH